MLSVRSCTKAHDRNAGRSPNGESIPYCQCEICDDAASRSINAGGRSSSLGAEKKKKKNKKKNRADRDLHFFVSRGLASTLSGKRRAGARLRALGVGDVLSKPSPSAARFGQDLVHLLARRRPRPVGPDASAPA